MGVGSGRRVPAALFGIGGVLYLVRGLMDLGSPAYSNVATLFDYAAVVLTTLWMVALGAAIASLAIARTVGGAARSVAWVPSAALVIGGVANLLEDGFGLSALGFLFGVGGGLAVVGLVALGGSTLLDRRNERGIGVVLLLLGAAFTLPPFGRTAGVGILCLVMAYVLNRRASRLGSRNHQSRVWTRLGRSRIVDQSLRAQVKEPDSVTIA